MIHTLPKVLPTINDAKGTAKTPVDVAAHLRALSDYMNVLHALTCGPDNCEPRTKLANAIRALNP